MASIPMCWAPSGAWRPTMARCSATASLIRPIVRSLATLVHQRRDRLVEDEADLIAALLLVQRGPLDARHLVGSWAGAIGHLQVNPSNVIAHGTDGDGDGAHRPAQFAGRCAGDQRAVPARPRLPARRRLGHGSGRARGLRLSAGERDADAAGVVLRRAGRRRGSRDGSSPIRTCRCFFMSRRARTARNS